jgi:tripartite-type tricarboxylate transporter receptor subunit TctC
VAPAKLPKDVLDKLNAEIVHALHEPDVVQKLTDAGVIVVANTPQQFGDFIKVEMEKAAKIIKAANIQPD